MTRLLMTRPERDSQDFAARLGVSNAIIAPLQKIVALGPLPPLAEGLIFTSAHGVWIYQMLEGPAGLPTWCVGPRTAQAAQEAGLKVQGVAPNAATLLDRQFMQMSLTYLHGTHTTEDIAAKLRRQGIQCENSAIYDQQKQPLSPEAYGHLLSGEPFVVPLFSPRSASLFHQACPVNAWSNLHIVAISTTLMDALPHDVASFHLASAPNGEGMLKKTTEVLALLGDG